MNAHKQIVKNLQNRVHPVNALVATSGIEDRKEAFSALQELQHDGRVQVKQIRLPDGKNTFPLYQLNYIVNHPKLVVDNS